MEKQIKIPKDLSFEKVWFMFQEAERVMSKNSLETERMFKETDKKIKELANLFTTQWGRLVEALIQPACLRLFVERGIDIKQSMENVKSIVNGNTLEIDVLLVNSNEVVVVEVKTTCRPQHIKELIEDLESFKNFFPQYKEYKVYGAIAALKYNAQSVKYAYRHGLFVLKSSGEGIVEIDNDEKFSPKIF